MVHKNKGKKRYFGTKVEEFFSHSSIHGFVYFSGRRTVGDRIVWVIAILISCTCAGFISSSQFAEMNKDPLQSNSETVDIKTVPFPGIYYLISCTFFRDSCA